MDRGDLRRIAVLGAQLVGRGATGGGVFVCWGMLVVVVLFMSDLGYLVVVELRWSEFLPAESRLEFIARHSAIAGIVSVGLLRYFWARHQWQQNIKAEGEARYQALNARIKPHFCSTH